MIRALLIGVSDYKFLERIPSCVNDINAMARVLMHPDTGVFKDDEVKCISDPDYSRMIEEIEQLFSNPDVKKNDVLLLYFSGHGFTDKTQELLLASRLTEKAKPVSASILSSVIHKQMKNSISWKQVVILDCCFSGSFINNSNNGTNFNKDVVVLASSRSTDYSRIKENGSLSIYTSYLIEGINKGAIALEKEGLISCKELHNYVKNKFAETKQEMKPVIYHFKEGLEISIAKRNKTNSENNTVPKGSPNQNKSRKNIRWFFLLIALILMVLFGVVWYDKETRAQKNKIEEQNRKIIGMINSCRDIDINSDLKLQQLKKELKEESDRINLSSDKKTPLDIQIIACYEYINRLQLWRSAKVAIEQSKATDTKNPNLTEAMATLNNGIDKILDLLNLLNKESKVLSQTGIDVQNKISYFEHQSAELKEIISFQEAINKAKEVYDKTYSPPDKQSLSEYIDDLNKAIKIVHEIILRKSRLSQNAQDKMEQWKNHKLKLEKLRQLQDLCEQDKSDSISSESILEEIKKLESAQLILPQSPKAKIKSSYNSKTSSIGEEFDARINSIGKKLCLDKGKEINYKLLRKFIDYFNKISREEFTIINSQNIKSYVSELEYLNQEFSKLYRSKSPLKQLQESFSSIKLILEDYNKIKELWSSCSPDPVYDCFNSNSKYWDYLTQTLELKPIYYPGLAPNEVSSKKYVEWKEIVKAIQAKAKEKITTIENYLHES